MGGIWMLKKLGSGYVGFAIGVIFGAIVATLTSYYVFEAALGSPDAARVFQIQECLVEKLNG
tara:strand:+ start:74 stop:259 length:186 start_codon:yes stop_codon:yes gene_type:complete